MKIKEVKQLVKEAIKDRIRMIDEAGNVAAIEAQISKVEEDMQECTSVKESLTGMENLKHYANPKTVGNLVKELDATLKELDKKRAELEKNKAKLAGGKSASTLVPVDVDGDGEISDDESYSDEDTLQEALRKIKNRIK